MSMLARTQQPTVTVTAATVLAGLTVYAIFSSNKRPAAQSREIIPSPRTTLVPFLSKDQVSRLAYPPDILPGSRDVDTPYGSMRVCEWGPENGRKVVFVHGDATPSPMFRSIANDLVAKGCRVMMFDLWGRGYTDTPADCQHDCRFYTLQILYALTSSPIPWTGESSGRFSLIGFSMGGTIILDFFAHHPKLVESIVLLGPGGMIAQLPTEYKSLWFQYPSLISTSAMRRIIGTTLGVSMANALPKSAKDIEFAEQGFTPAGAVQFQFDHHAGHVRSFLSNIQYGPLQRQDRIWERAGSIIGGTSSSEDARKSVLFGGKVLCVCGADDSVVVPAEVEQSLQRFMSGPEHFEFKTVPGGHGFPWSEGHAVAAHVIEFWGL